MTARRDRVPRQLATVRVGLSPPYDLDRLVAALVQAGLREELGFELPRASEVRIDRNVTGRHLARTELAIVDRAHFTALDGALDRADRVTVLCLDTSATGDVTRWQARYAGFTRIEPPDGEGALAAAAMAALREGRLRTDRVLLWILDDKKERFAPDGPWAALEETARDARALTVVRSLVTPERLRAAGEVASAWAAELVRPARSRGTPVVVVADNVFSHDHSDLGEAWCETLRVMLPDARCFVASAENVPYDAAREIRPFSLLEQRKLRASDTAAIIAAIGIAGGLPRPADEPGLCLLPHAVELIEGSGLVGATPVMQVLKADVERAAPLKSPILLLGDSGVGKEVVARAIHAGSGRVPFVPVNCAALLPTTIESELFGRQKGAFTDAQDAKGLFDAADKGTLFLDEIGEIPFHLQAKLLRAVQFGEIRAVGSDRNHFVDVLVIAATNRDLAHEVTAERFRGDLRMRLGTTITVPRLRDHREDISLLISAFTHAGPITPRALRRLSEREWPGNVRELETEVKSADACRVAGVLATASLRAARHGWPLSAAAALRAAPQRLRGLAICHELFAGAAAATLVRGPGAAGDAVRILARATAAERDAIRAAVWDLLEWEEPFALELAAARSQPDVQAALDALANAAGSRASEAAEAWLAILGPSGRLFSLASVRALIAAFEARDRIEQERKREEQKEKERAAFVADLAATGPEVYDEPPKPRIRSRGRAGLERPRPAEATAGAGRTTVPAASVVSAVPNTGLDAVEAAAEFRFEVALSFAGDDKRDRVRAVAEFLRDELGKGRVFFDEWFEAELAGHDAPTVLQSYYRKHTRLVVTCACKRYAEKPWTQEEWRAIQAFERDLRDAGTDNRRRMRLLPLRFGDGDVDGLFDTAIVPDVRSRDPSAIAQLILERLRLARGVPLP